jgi:hypothetical protein
MPDETAVVEAPAVEEIPNEQEGIEGLLVREGKDWVIQYQPTGPDGQTIAPPQKFTGATKNEVIRALIKKGQNADQYIHRLKTQTPTPKKNGTTIKPLTTDEEFQLGMELQIPTSARKAARRLLEADLGISFDDLRDSVAERKANQTNAVTYQFLRKHIGDFYDCEANGNVLVKYLTANQLDYTVNNLEIALDQCRDLLASAPSTPAPKTAEPRQQEETPQTTRTPSGTTGIVPGSFSGSRPSAGQNPGLTKRDYIVMAREKPAEYQRHFRDPKLRVALDKAMRAG